MWGIFILTIIFGVLFVVALSFVIFKRICDNIATKYYDSEPPAHATHYIDMIEQDSLEEYRASHPDRVVVGDSTNNSNHPCRVPKSCIIAVENTCVVEYYYKKEEEEAQARYKEWKNNRPKVVATVGGWDNVLLYIFYGLCALIGVGLFISVMTIIICYGVKPTDILRYQEMYSMIQQAIDSGTDLENIAITQTKIEFNTWLSEVIVSLERWGNWSTWYPWKEQILQLSYLF